MDFIDSHGNPVTFTVTTTPLPDGRRRIGDIEFRTEPPGDRTPEEVRAKVLRIVRETVGGASLVKAIVELPDDDAAHWRLVFLTRPTRPARTPPGVRGLRRACSASTKPRRPRTASCAGPSRRSATLPRRGATRDRPPGADYRPHVSVVDGVPLPVTPLTRRLCERHSRPPKSNVSDRSGTARATNIGVRTRTRSSPRCRSSRGAASSQSFPHAGPTVTDRT
jgi:hypothetical protein